MMISSNTSKKYTVNGLRLQVNVASAVLTQIELECFCSVPKLNGICVGVFNLIIHETRRISYNQVQQISTIFGISSGVLKKETKKGTKKETKKETKTLGEI